MSVRVGICELSVWRRLSMTVALSLLGMAALGAPEGKVCCPCKLAQYQADVKAILPSFASYGVRQGSRVPLLDPSGKGIGVLLVAPACKRERLKGFRDVINAGVVVSSDGLVLGVVTGENRESRKFMERIRKSGFMNRWNGRSLKAAAALKVDAVTHATFSSNALRSEVGAVLREAVRQEEPLK